MRIAIMQPYLFPYIGYYQLFSCVDHFIFLDDVNYINRGWINRNRILVNKQEYLFTLPLANASQNKMINEIQILSDQKQISSLLRTIDFAYRKAPYYSSAMPVILQFFQAISKGLASVAAESITTIAEYLNFDFSYSFSSSYLNSGLKKENRIIELCQIVGATEYINLPGGVHLYSKSDFLQYNITLSFLVPDKIEYKQFSNEFIPWLSIIDVVMFNSCEQAKYMLTKYHLE